MSRFLIALLLLAICCPLSVAAESPQQAQLKEVVSTLQKDFPKIPLQQVSTTPVEGLYEIVTTNDEILYFFPKSGHLLAGDLWNKSGHNLTRESRAQMMSARLAQLPLDKAIKIGNGLNQVVEISDPDCPFCREGSAFFSGRTDVTRYIFLYPLDKLHPQAEAKARYILSSKNPQEAYEEVFNGEYDKKPVPNIPDNGLLAEHQAIARSIGVRGTPQYWINGQYVSGTNLNEFARLLNQGPLKKP